MRTTIGIPRSMKKSMGTLVALALVVCFAPGAAAETLDRDGSGKATIHPSGAPADANVTKARVTIKRGSKTLAKNKSAYRARKGRYKVTSTIRFSRTIQVPIDPERVWASCEIDAIEVVDHQLQTRPTKDPARVQILGNVTVKYSGACEDNMWAEDFSSQTLYEWYGTWLTQESVYGVVGAGLTSADLLEAHTSNGWALGMNVDWYTGFMSGDRFLVGPTDTRTEGPVTKKYVRTVTVR